MLTTPELVWLLAAVAKGDQRAFERLYEATAAKLYAAVLRIVRRTDLAVEFGRAIRSGRGIAPRLHARDRPRRGA